MGICNSVPSAPSYYRGRSRDGRQWHGRPRCGDAHPGPRWQEQSTIGFFAFAFGHQPIAAFNRRHNPSCLPSLHNGLRRDELRQPPRLCPRSQPALTHRALCTLGYLERRQVIDPPRSASRLFSITPKLLMLVRGVNPKMDAENSGHNIRDFGPHVQERRSKNTN